jgi:hypothetical protein
LRNWSRSEDSFSKPFFAPTGKVRARPTLKKLPSVRVLRQWTMYNLL